MSDDSTPPTAQLAQTTLDNDALVSDFDKAQFSDRFLIRTIISRPDGGAGLAGKRVRVGGWVKTGRKADKDSFAFLELNDGSCPGNLQVIVEADKADLGQLVSTGTCLSVDGTLKLPPLGVKQKVELRVENVLHVGPVDPATYPLPKTRLTLEFLRDFVHLRPRTNTVKLPPLYVYILIGFSMI